MSTLQQGQVLLRNVRLSFPKLFTPEGIKGDPTSKPRYGCQLLVPKTDKAALKALQAEVDRLTTEKFKGVKVKAKDLFFKDGDGEDADEATAGCWVVSANRSEKQGPPSVVDTDPRKNLRMADGRPYGGCYVNALIGVYVPSNWSKICASIEVVQFVKDGERFGGGGVDAAAVMPTLDAEEDTDFEP